VRRLPDPISRLVVSDDAAHRLGGAVPSPAVAFLLALIALPSLFWLIALKRTTNWTAPEEWLMSTVVPTTRGWLQANLPPVDALLLVVSALGSGWFVALGFGVLGLVALARGRRDLALLLAFGTLCFPIEWALKYFTSAEVISLAQLGTALFDVGGVGLDDIADFPAGHALRATVLYGLAAFCVARLAHDQRQGMVAYGVAVVLIGAISLTRIYLGAHYPMDVLGGWMAGGALVAVLVAVHVLRVDERAQEAGLRAAPSGARPTEAVRRVAVPRLNQPTERPAPPPAAQPEAGDGV
jgi:membrane-associated phospholipid phosphatase